ncbi:hypothetical protein PV416_30715 [Streptomyces ipomoeae]|uniref:Beta-ketoacyl synthase N-terminal domain-containing protein n=1 Tax=Streptomyces ipomoeae 91-03 TaxID=698759 RepID=L1L6A2_9ACTN|nr:hypothetical protein [Streptomyces ipomoeae]EKX68294.1 hypothetical protein STRIP9103_02080 [Streptomyces ipomoeae 91-03]MDX2698134.1 hypothetical protein [Streptomyces ipomoeae]MDX2825337.1 hypothetical protein [Streptomyces ipomoeae]MDX2843802.1 hypothetical protein [Streptomyces ipomoeae]MDX2877969.1 hypothetical protein [Streptomyces ipomoeae]
MTTTEKADESGKAEMTGSGETVTAAGTARSAEKTTLRSPLGILTTATASHDTGRDGDIVLPRLPGFVESAFSPLAYEVAARCLTERPGDGGRTAVALASLMGDTTTADLASRRVVSGRVHNPLLFMQATANSVLGHMSREFGITGQMFSLSTLDDPVTELLAMADLLLEDPELDRVLVVGVELGGGERLAAAYRELSAERGLPVPDLPETAGLAVAVLLGRPDTGAPVTIRSTETTATAETYEPTAPADTYEPTAPTAAYDGDRPTPPATHPGSVQGLFDLAAAHRRLLRDGGSHVLVTAPRTPAFLLTAERPPERNETETHAHQ